MKKDEIEMQSWWVSAEKARWMYYFRFIYFVSVIWKHWKM